MCVYLLLDGVVVKVGESLLFAHEVIVHEHEVDHHVLVEPPGLRETEWPTSQPVSVRDP
jgi:hypothetical protein